MLALFILDKSSSLAQELTAFQAFRLIFGFLRKFAVCSKPPSGDNHRKALC